MFIDKYFSGISANSKMHKMRGEYLSVKKDESLFHPESSDNCLFLVINGSVNLNYSSDSGQIISKEIKKDEFFEFGKLINGKSTINSAVASENSNLLKISIIEQNLPGIDNKAVKVNDELLIKRSSLSSLNLNSLNVFDQEGIKTVRCNFQRANLNKAVDFKNFVINLIDEGNIKIIIDLTACKLIDSTFLGTLIVILKRLSFLKGRMSLICSSDISSWLFVMTKMDSVFNIYQNYDEAIKSFSE